MKSLKMEVLGASQNKALAANAAATASKKAARSGKKNGAVKMDAMSIKMDKRNLGFLNSDYFKKWLELWEIKTLYKGSKVLEGRWAEMRKDAAAQASWLAEVTIMAKAEGHYDGFSWTFEEVRDLFKGLRSEAIRRAKATSGFNAKVYFTLAHELEDKSVLRGTLKVLNRPQLHKEPRL